MGETTGIRWTDMTFNPWIGCTKVGPGCDHCYAERENNRRQWNGGVWGIGTPRKRTAPSNWNQPFKWNRQAARFIAEHGHPPRVFTASLADVFDNEVNPAWRLDLFNFIIEPTPNLRWQIVTKRVSLVRKMVPAGFFERNQHVGLVVTVCTQAEADRDVPRLLELKAELGIAWVGLSVEPMLGPIDLTRIEVDWGHINALSGTASSVKDTGPGPASAPWVAKLDWVIIGGESGDKARPMHPDWALGLLHQCEAAGVAVFFKQWGEYVVVLDRDKQDPDWRADYREQYGNKAPRRWLNLAGGQGFHGERFVVVEKIGTKMAGNLIAGHRVEQFPPQLC